MIKCFCDVCNKEIKSLDGYDLCAEDRLYTSTQKYGEIILNGVADVNFDEPYLKRFNHDKKILCRECFSKLVKMFFDGKESAYK